MLATILRGELNEGCDCWRHHIIDSSNLASLRISELRTKAHGKGVDVDGSRETLIAALKSAYEAELEAARAMPLPLPEYDDDDLMMLMKNQTRNQKRNSTWLLSIDRVESLWGYVRRLF